MELENYFDYAATTPVDSRVIAEMIPYFGIDFGNPHSIHGWGQKAKSAAELARKRVADSLGCEDPSQIVFTSGATESNNWVISQFDQGVFGPWEHDSVREPSVAKGFRMLNPDEIRTGEIKAGETEPDGQTDPNFVSISAGSNETGEKPDLQSLAAPSRILHSDATQVAFKYKLDLQGIDFFSFSAHKFYGPKGIGGLYLQNPNFSPLLKGGHQENGRRAGTLNVPAIVGMGLAAEIASETQSNYLAKMTALRGILMNETERVSDVIFNGGIDPWPHIFSVSFRGIEAESLVIALDSLGFAVSSGAACSSGSNLPSPVLIANGLPMEYIRGTLRISIGRYNSQASTERLAHAIVQSVRQLRALSKTEN